MSLTATIQPSPARGRGSHAFPVEVTQESDKGLVASGKKITHFVDMLVNDMFARCPVFLDDDANPRIGFSTLDGLYSIPAYPPKAGDATEYTLAAWADDLARSYVPLAMNKTYIQYGIRRPRITFPA